MLTLALRYYFPVNLFSNHLNTGNDTPQNNAVNSWPMFPPFEPLMGPVYQATFMPNAAPMNPKAKAAIAPHPDGSRSWPAHASQS